MALKNVKYVLIDENNEPIKNEDGSLEIKTTEIILENTAEVEEFNASNLENNKSENQRITNKKYWINFTNWTTNNSIKTNWSNWLY